LLGVSEQGDGLAEILSAGECGTAGVLTVATPAMEVLGIGDIVCAFALPGSDVTAAGPDSGSAIKVDGNNAYLPGAVHSVLNNKYHLALTQTKLTVSVSRPNNKGDVVITESAPLMRCSVSDTYPPTVGSCPALVATGVTFKRVSTLFRGAHQVQVRDSFASGGSAHTVNLQYVGTTVELDSGAPGYLYPGGSTSQLGPPGSSHTGLGGKAGTMFIRTDKFADADEPTADTFGISWSKGPQKVLFDGDGDLWALPYSLNVPAHGTARLGFAYSEQPTTAKVKPLAALAVADMMSTPTIGSPHNGAHIAGHSVTVKGAVAIGANGLPTSVKVNGHPAALTVNATKTKVSYRVTFSEPSGKHKLTVTATDSAGNKRSRSITVTTG
jgi:hypothetical protein